MNSKFMDHGKGPNLLTIDKHGSLTNQLMSLLQDQYFRLAAASITRVISHLSMNHTKTTEEVNPGVLFQLKTPGNKLRQRKEFPMEEI